MLLKCIGIMHRTPAKLTPAPAAKDFAEQPLKDKKVYWADYNMVQAEILFLTKGDLYSKDLVPTVALYNEYFGGGMGSIVFQDLRESKALAYSAYSGYSNADKLGRSNYNLSYIGTQSDKLPEAMAGMEALLTDMPVAEANLEIAKNAIRNSISHRAHHQGQHSDELRARQAPRPRLRPAPRRVRQHPENELSSELQKFQQAKVKRPEPGNAGHRLERPAQFQGAGQVRPGAAAHAEGAVRLLIAHWSVVGPVSCQADGPAPRLVLQSKPRHHRQRYLIPTLTTDYY